MDADTLRALQAPLKERYREQPDTARITLRAQLDTLLRLTERYCVVYQTLARTPALAVSRRAGAR